MKMFLTRLGFGSKMVVTGDITQVDLPGRHPVGAARGPGHPRRRRRRALRRADRRTTSCGTGWSAPSSTPTAAGTRTQPAAAARRPVSIDVLNETESTELDELELVAPARATSWTQLRVHPKADLCLAPGRRGRHGDPARAVDGPARAHRRHELPDGRAAPRARGAGARGGRARRHRALPEVAARQAREAGHATEEELLLLTTHGILHLLGYDHAEPDEETRDVRAAAPAAAHLPRHAAAARPPDRRGRTP